MLDGQSGADQHNGGRRRQTYPLRFQPPFNAPQRENGTEQRKTTSQQAEGQEIQLFERLETITRWQLEQQYATQRE